MSEPSRDVLFLSAARTPIGRFQGSLGGLSSVQLGAVAIRAAVQRANLPELAEIAEVWMGHVVQAGAGQAPARQAGILAGLPASVGAVTVNKVCGSGMKALMSASQVIRLGEADLFVVGGMESMSRAPFLVDGRTGALRYGHSQLTDALLHDGLWDPFENWAMGEAAEFIAKAYEISREEMDAYALGSHQKAIAAIDEGCFRAEITPVEVPGRKGEVIRIEVDEAPRRDTTLEVLARLRPAFLKDGLVTAGNAPGLSDGAAALVIASRTKAQQLGNPGLARLAGSAQVAVEPKWLFDAPRRVLPLVLEKTGWSLSEVDLIELNEAFAAQALANGKGLAGLGWDWEKVNVNGGAIALGHPIGASGARIVCTLIYALRARSLRRGIAMLCMGGAEATAVAVEIEQA
jgi:acetyl-CoA C-acetyltransferase